MAILSREVSNRKITGTINVPQSKALLHRYLICCGLCEDHPLLDVTNESDDIKSTSKCLGCLGLGFQSEADEARKGIYTLEEESHVDENGFFRINCGKSGSTYKFLMPVAGAFGKPCRFELDGSLVYDSMDQFYRVLRTHGVKREILRPDLIEVSGQMTAGTFIIPGIADGQTISGLLMALPCLKENSTVMVEKPIRSEAYVDMTIELMREAGIEIHVTKDQGKISRIYKVKGSQKYSIKNEIRIEGDWTLAAYWLVGAAISRSSVTCTNLNIESLQGDRAILNILDKFGAHLTIKWHDNPDAVLAGNEVTWTDVTVRGDSLTAADIDAADIPDLVPAVVLLGCAADGITIIRNAMDGSFGNERLKNIIRVMTGLGAQITDTSDGLIIVGNGSVPLEGGTVNSHHDYKIAMMAAIAACISDKNIVIENPEVISKACPTFFNDLETLKRF